MGPEIIVQHVSGSTMAGREQRFAKPTVTIGRHPDCDVAFDSHRDLAVSSRHAELYTVGDDLFIKDLGSRNGTYVNSNRVTQPQKITSGDVLSFGYDGPAAHAMLNSPRNEPTMPSKKEKPIGQSTLNRVVADVVGRQTSKQSGLVLGVVGMLAFGIGTFTGYLAVPRLLGDSSSTAAAPVADSPVPLAPSISAFGRLEPNGGLINISATPGEIVDKLLVQEGDLVTKDQELAHLQSKRLLEVELAYAQAALEDANAQATASSNYGDALASEARFAIAQTGEPLDLEIKALESQIEVLKNNLKIATDDTKRLVDLGDKVPGEQLARQRMVEKGAQLELQSAESKLNTLNKTLRLKRDQARAQLESAQANQARLKTSIALESAQKNVDRVKAKLELATIRAPRNGRAVKIFVDEGEVISAKPVVQLADTDEMYVTAEVYESDVQRVKVGQKVTIVSAALPEELHGEVETILFTVANDGLRSLDPTAPSDVRVVPVKVRLNKAEVVRHRDLLTRLINLQVDVYIETESDS